MLQPAGRQANDDDRERAYYENNVGLLEEALSVAMSKAMKAGASEHPPEDLLLFFADALRNQRPAPHRERVRAGSHVRTALRAQLHAEHALRRNQWLEGEVAACRLDAAWWTAEQLNLAAAEARLARDVVPASSLAALYSAEGLDEEAATAEDATADALADAEQRREAAEEALAAAEEEKRVLSAALNDARVALARQAEMRDARTRGARPAGAAGLAASRFVNQERLEAVAGEAAPWSEAWEAELREEASKLRQLRGLARRWRRRATVRGREAQQPASTSREEPGASCG